MERHPRVTTAGVCACALALLMLQSAAQAAFSIASPTGDWGTAFVGSQFDPSSDQQTGQGESDLVGDATHAALFWHFAQGNLANHTDGTFYFRARVSGKKGTGTGWRFTDVLTIGLDFASPTYGTMDLFLVSNSKNGAERTTIYGSAGGTSPGTTSFGSQVGAIYTHDASNYGFQFVSSTSDNTSPAPLVTDLDRNGATDGFVTFAIPFADIVAAARMRGFTIDDTTEMRFSVFTATQENNINQDVNGVGPRSPGPNDPWNTPWTSISTTPIAASAIPEPGFVMTALAVVVVATGLRPRRRLAL